MLLEEINDLARQLATTENEDVRDSADILCRLYCREVLIAAGMIAVDSMVTDGSEAIDCADPRLESVRVRFRDRMRALLAWGRETGRLCG